MILAETITSELSGKIEMNESLADAYTGMGKSHNSFMAKSEALEAQALLDKLSQPFRKLLGVGPVELISPNKRKKKRNK